MVTFGHDQPPPVSGTSPCQTSHLLHKNQRLIMLQGVVHNHPNGDPSPSQQDIHTTSNIIQACRSLGISVHDNILLGTAGHSSISANGLISRRAIEPPHGPERNG